MSVVSVTVTLSTDGLDTHIYIHMLYIFTYKDIRLLTFLPARKHTNDDDRDEKGGGKEREQKKTKKHTRGGKKMRGKYIIQ